MVNRLGADSPWAQKRDMDAYRHCRFCVCSQARGMQPATTAKCPVIMKKNAQLTSPSAG